MTRFIYFVDDVPLRIYCKENNIPYHTITRIIRETKLSEKRSIEEYFRKKNDKYYKCYYKMSDNSMSVKEYCEINNIDYRNLIRKMRFYGCSAEEILSRDRSFHCKHFYKGKPVIELENYRLIIDRINKGWSIREAVERPKREKIFYKGKPFKSYCKTQKEYASKILRVRRGWSIEAALLTPIGGKIDRNKKRK